MKIKRKEIVNRVYEGIDCYSFDYFMAVNDGEKETPLKLSFLKCESMKGLNLWLLQCIVDGLNDTTMSINMNDQVFSVKMYLASNMALETVVEAGLLHLQNSIKYNAQKLMNIDFAIAEVVR